MKSLLIVILMLSSSFAFAEPTPTSREPTVSSVTFHMDVNQLTDQLARAVKPLADKIGETAPAVYQMAVKDAEIDGQYYKFISIVLGIFLVALIGLTHYTATINKWDGDYILIILIIVLVGGIIEAKFVSMAIHNLYNPQYMALQKLLHMFTGMGN